MKYIKIYAYGLIGLLSAGLIVSCTKSFDEKITPITNFSDKTLAQLHIATVGASRNYLYVDGNPVTGVLMSSGSVFPTTGYAFSITGGVRSFVIRDTLRTSTQVPLVFAENMQVGKLFTIFAYDTITSPKQITVATNIVIPSDSTARLRFANFVHNSFDVPGVDVFSKRRNANIFTNVRRTEVSEFIPYASASRNPLYTANSNDTLFIRETGTMNALVTINGFNPTEKRSYTLVYRGSHRGTKAATIFSNY